MTSNLKPMMSLLNSLEDSVSMTSIGATVNIGTKVDAKVSENVDEHVAIAAIIESTHTDSLTEFSGSSTVIKEFESGLGDKDGKSDASAKIITTKEMEVDSKLGEKYNTNAQAVKKASIGSRQRPSLVSVHEAGEGMDGATNVKNEIETAKASEDQVGAFNSGRRRSSDANALSTEDQLKKEKLVLMGAKKIIENLDPQSTEYIQAQALIAELTVKITVLEQNRRNEALSKASEGISDALETLNTHSDKMPVSDNQSACDTVLMNAMSQTASATTEQSLKNGTVEEEKIERSTSRSSGVSHVSIPQTNLVTRHNVPFKVQLLAEQNDVRNGSGALSVTELKLSLLSGERSHEEKTCKVYGLVAFTSQTVEQRFDFESINNKPHIRSINLRKIDPITITPDDRMTINVHGKIAPATLKRSGTMAPKTKMNKIKKLFSKKVAGSSACLTIPPLIEYDDKPLGNVNQSLRSILANTTDGVYKGQFSDVESMITKPVSVNLSLTVYLPYVYHAGWIDLQKHDGERVQGWQQYYVVVGGTHITLYRDGPAAGSGEQVPQQCLPVYTIDLWDVKNKQVEKTRETKRRNAFKLDTTSGIYFVSAHSVEDLEEWSEAINKALSGLRTWWTPPQDKELY
eukprot:CFRG6512T1